MEGDGHGNRIRMDQMVGRAAGEFAMNGFTGDEVAVGYAADARQGPPNIVRRLPFWPYGGPAVRGRKPVW